MQKTTREFSWHTNFKRWAGPWNVKNENQLLSPGFSAVYQKLLACYELSLKLNALNLYINVNGCNGNELVGTPVVAIISWSGPFITHPLCLNGDRYIFLYNENILFYSSTSESSRWKSYLCFRRAWNLDGFYNYCLPTVYLP